MKNQTSKVVTENAMARKQALLKELVSKNVVDACVCCEHCYAICFG